MRGQFLPKRLLLLPFLTVVSSVDAIKVCVFSEFEIRDHKQQRDASKPYRHPYFVITNRPPPKRHAGLRSVIDTRV